MGFRRWSAVACLVSWAVVAEPRSAYFADGYHGGVYGHYPSGYTAFLVEQLAKHPGWKLNLEIEPETWDAVKVSEPEAYAAFQRIVEDPSDAGRVEFVNPTYAQSYLFQASGESVIRQFDRGIRRLRQHFPYVVLTTYSSEEPCFTSCLPPVLKSFGYEFAVLKNPDTCWGGYTTAYGGELVNWIGPDGTSILTVPRYACEALQPDSCWQTIAFGNSPEFIEACFRQGIEHPVGMCLQDAGWRGGPWLDYAQQDPYRPSQSVTWRGYFRGVTGMRAADDWRFTQEDVRPGLMWGAQVLQRIARQSREAEHRLLTAEKLAAMAFIEAGRPSRTEALDEAWRNVLLSQHHDCWIVPYNGRPGNTWADQVRRWTTAANAVSDLSVQRALDVLLSGGRSRGRRYVRLFNPTALACDAVVPVVVPARADRPSFVSVDAEGRRVPAQWIDAAAPGTANLLVRASLPPMGYATVELRQVTEPVNAPPLATLGEGSVVLEGDLYRVEFEPSKGGTLRSLVAKRLGNREFVDRGNERRFNELRGHFYEEGGFRASSERPAEVRIVENGPLRATVEITGELAGHPFRQRVTMTQGSPVLDCSVRLDWKGNPRIGEFEEREGWRNRRRPAYDDRFKLLVLFPTALAGQRIAKGAPFDVCESRLTDTFYHSWEDIKNNLILDWVDVRDGEGDSGLALFSDHTTTYTHGPDFPLGLTLQYAGKGLWGRDYQVEGPTEVRYALMPHAGDWREAEVPTYSAAWQEPAAGLLASGAGQPMRSLVDLGDSGWLVPAMYERDGALYVRLFNACGDHAEHDLGFGFAADRIERVELDGRVVETLRANLIEPGRMTVRLRIPRFGVRTLRLGDLRFPRAD